MNVLVNFSLPETPEKKVMEVSWTAYWETAERLVEIIDASEWKFDHIVCVARGGMFVGDMLSRVFKKPLAVIVASSYRGEDGKQQKQLVLSEIARISDLGKNVLLLDDLADSGKTLTVIKNRLQENYPDISEVRSAVLWYKSCSTFKPDYFAKDVEGETWINQPFEKYDNLSPKDLLKQDN